MVLTIPGIDKVSTTGYMSASIPTREAARHDSHANYTFNTLEPDNLLLATARKLGIVSQDMIRPVTTGLNFSLSNDVWEQEIYTRCSCCASTSNILIPFCENDANLWSAQTMTLWATTIV